MKHITTSELQQHNKVNKPYVCVIARGHLTFMQQYRGGYFRLRLFPVSTGAPCPWCPTLVADWPTAGRRPIGVDYSSQGGVFSHSHFLTRRKDCAGHQCYMAQLHLLQTAKLHFNIRDAKISISLVRNGTTEAMLYSSDNSPSDDRPCLFLYQYHFSPSQILVWPLPSFSADCSSASNLCKLQPRRPKLPCTQLLSQNGCRIRP